MDKKEIKNQRAHELREWYKSVNRCTVCHKNPPEKGKTLCLVCLMDKREKDYNYYHRNNEKMKEKARERDRKRYETRKLQGLCVDCGKPIECGVRCKSCLDKSNLRRRKKREKPWKDFSYCIRCDNKAVQGYKMCSYHLQKQREMVVKREEKYKNGELVRKINTNNDIFFIKNGESNERK